MKKLLLAGGIVGPAVFILDWAALSATQSGYSPVQQAISELAASGAPHRGIMTGGFAVYGAGLIGYGLALRSEVAGPEWVFAVGSGLATFGLAAFPLGSPVSGKVHAVFAGLGYATLAAMPLAASWRLRHEGHQALAKLAVAAGSLTGACLVASVVGPCHGLLQRIGLTTGDLWIMGTAAYLLTRRGAAATAKG